jgi:hypothetical protein
VGWDKEGGFLEHRSICFPGSGERVVLSMGEETGGMMELDFLKVLQDLPYPHACGVMADFYEDAGLDYAANHWRIKSRLSNPQYLPSGTLRKGSPVSIHWVRREEHALRVRTPHTYLSADPLSMWWTAGSAELHLTLPGRVISLSLTTGEVLAQHESPFVHWDGHRAWSKGGTLYAEYGGLLMPFNLHSPADGPAEEIGKVYSDAVYLRGGLVRYACGGEIAEPIPPALQVLMPERDRVEDILFLDVHGTVCRYRRYRGEIVPLTHGVSWVRWEKIPGTQSIRLLLSRGDRLETDETLEVELPQ